MATSVLGVKNSIRFHENANEIWLGQAWWTRHRVRQSNLSWRYIYIHTYICIYCRKEISYQNMPKWLWTIWLVLQHNINLFFRSYGLQSKIWLFYCATLKIIPLLGRVEGLSTDWILFKPWFPLAGPFKWRQYIRVSPFPGYTKYHSLHKVSKYVWVLKVTTWG